jgi:hypothetical protein
MQYGKSAIALCVALVAGHGAAHEADPHGAQKPKAPPAPKTSPLPARKGGLWEVTVRSDDLVLKRKGQATPRPQTVRQCTSAEAEPVMLTSLMPGQADCHSLKVRRRGKGGGYDITSTCYVHDNRLDAQMELRGDLQSAYSGSFSVTYPRTPMNNTGRMLFEGRWLGACQPGQRPGDMVLPNGVTVNVVDDYKRAVHNHSNGHEGHKH